MQPTEIEIMDISAPEHKESLITMRNYLIKLKNSSDIKKDLHYKSSGLCSNLSYEVYGTVETPVSGDIAFQFILNCVEDWPRFSGICSYPIKGGSLAYDVLDKWEGEQLEERLGLIDHLLTKIEQLLK